MSKHKDSVDVDYNLTEWLDGQGFCFIACQGHDNGRQYANIIFDDAIPFYFHTVFTVAGKQYRGEMRFVIISNEVALKILADAACKYVDEELILKLYRDSNTTFSRQDKEWATRILKE